MKLAYIDLMERTLSAYSPAHILRYFDAVREHGLQEHGFPRLTANIGILISHGRRTDLYDIFIEMMDFCCTNIPQVKAANDFSVKEIIFCIMELEKNSTVSQKKISAWKSCLQRIEPMKCYDKYALTPEDKVYNWACFTGVSEYMRCYIGIADTYDFVDTQMASQLQWLDENGMYRDPGNPIVYDLVPRGLFAVLLHFGYNGKYRAALDQCLKKSGILTLKMQSVTGEIPYGGRSNQFPHNEAHMAILMEFEANRYYREGDLVLASAFKRAAKKAIDSITYWLTKTPIRHVKNRYPTETGYGCEKYAYFDKYMITVASFLYVANLICNDEIPVSPADLDTCYTLETSRSFHKLFLRAGDYFAEFDMQADPNYDASGLGRLHRKDAPPVICLSTPCTRSPHYKLGISDPASLSLCPGVFVDGEACYAVDTSSTYTLLEHSSNGKEAFAAFSVDVCGKKNVSATYVLRESGMSVTLAGEGILLHQIPAFCFDGENESRIQCEGNILEVCFDGWICRYTASCEITDTGMQAFNRNGLYQVFQAKGQDKIDLQIEICKG